MTPRTIHIGTSFFAVLVAFWTYMLLAVPFIEPPPKKITIIDDHGGDAGGTDKREGDFSPLFSDPAAWELHEPKVINIDSARILWKDYKNEAGGWVDLTPATMIFLPDDPTLDMRERIRSAVVMEVPEGARLRFDPPLVIGRVKEVHLIEGKLRGQVTIRSRGKPGNKQGDLKIITSDVSLTEQRVWTPNVVDFHWGPNFGTARQMELKLLPRQGPNAGNQSGPNVGGIEECDFQYVERLHLDMSHVDEAKMRPGVSNASTSAAPTVNQPVMPFLRGSDDKSGPLEITCKGPFRFNLVQKVATFNDQVDVFRVHPTGPSDHLSCEQLSVIFTQSAGTSATKSGPAGLDLQPQRLDAIGTPAVITAPSEQMYARGEHLSYDVVSGAAVLDGGQEVTLKNERFEFHARNLHGTPSKEPGRLATIVAQGPGTLHAAMSATKAEAAQHPAQILDARWHDYLNVVPQDDDDVVSLTGDAGLNIQAMGKLDAQKIWFWLKNRPPKPGSQQNEHEPDKMRAQGSVRGDSQQLSAAVDRMEVWFNVPPPVAASPSVVSPAGPAQTPTEGNRAGPVQSNTAQAKPDQPKSHIEISGRLLQASVTMRDGEHGELTEARVIDNVVLRETQTAIPGEQPLLVTGLSLTATNANAPDAKVIVIGEPAHMEGHKLSLTGPVIELDKGANSLTMRGPGQMELPIDRDFLAGKPLATPQPLKVDWQTKMTFDGLTAEFDGGVNARSTSQLLQTKLLKLRLQSKVTFANGKNTEPKPETLFCDGGAYIENRGFDALQQMQTSLDRMQLKQLTVNLASGDIYGLGPGSLINVSRGKAGSMLGPAGLGGDMSIRPTSIPASIPARPNQGSDPAIMTGTHLNFLGDLRGNIYRKEATFSKQVRVANSRVPSWRSTLESDDPQQLGPDSTILHGDSLTVLDLSPNRQPGMSADRTGNVEALFIGNVLVEGVSTTSSGASTTFTARSSRMSYSQQKAQCIFEGDGRMPAEFGVQKQQGVDPMRTSAQKFIYWLKTRQCDVDGARSLDMNDFQAKQFQGLRGGR